MNNCLSNSNILGYMKLFCDNRDTISLSFEYTCGGIIKINRFYYENDSFRRFLESFDYEGNYTNIKVSSLFQSVDVFERNIKRIAKHFPEEKYSLLCVLFNKYRDTLINILIEEEYGYNESMDRFIGEINNVFTGYQYSIRDRQHLFDDQFLQLIANNERHYPKAIETSHEDIIAEFPQEYRIIDDPSLYELRIYDVGQASCSALIKYINSDKKDYKVVIVFDFGLEMHKTNKSLKEMISKIDENTTILISHFDLDHINNISKFTLSKTCRWLFPEKPPLSSKTNLLYQDVLAAAKKKSISGKRLYSYKTPYDFSPYLRINQNEDGVRDKRFTHTRINAECLIVTLHLNNTNVLIPADALYKDFPDDVFNYMYDYVLIPHHGCRYLPISEQNNVYCDCINKVVSNNPIGIVQSGKNGAHYGHANTEHLKWYKNVFAFNNSLFFRSRFVMDKTYFCGIVRDNYYSIRFSKKEVNK